MKRSELTDLLIGRVDADSEMLIGYGEGEDRVTAGIHRVIIYIDVDGPEIVVLDNE